MDRSQDHYTVLGVAPTADPEVIRAAYRVLAQRHHPDRNATGDAATMVRLNQAYAVLSNPQLRANYDRMHVYGHAQRQPNATISPVPPVARDAVVVTTYDHRGRLHAYDARHTVS